MYPASFAKWVRAKCLGGLQETFPHQNSPNALSDCRILARLLVKLAGARYGDVYNWCDLFQVMEANGVFIHGCTAADFRAEQDSHEVYLGHLATITWAFAIKYELARCIDAKVDTTIREVMAQDTLKGWLQSTVTPYGLTIENWTTSFQDGVVLLALLNVATGNVDMSKVDANDGLRNVQKAVESFEIQLGIAPLITPGLVCGRVLQDGFLKKSLMIYVAMIHNRMQEI